MAYWTGTTTVLAASGAGDTWTGPTKLRERLDTVQGSVFTDKAGTLRVQQSPDGTNWDVDETVAVTASTSTPFQKQLYLPYWRLKMTNTAVTAQTVLRLSASTQAGGDS